ncbi:hypothetical protein SMD20_05255 [Nonomuraea sp. LP-02]|uniref:hypothetical protein n=1 Tax=Nonomuraea sp. LP-02 TaxID=3097960 RepID=UPI002E34C7BF|nr:hypothetical protein [Nonomuraea sp. LP-02]MED7923624.1 hypothetical protein [Nonomuraea sp. LP-02]
MWIAVAVPAAIVIGILVWWLRRDRPTGPEAGPEREPEADAAFVEGLGAYDATGEALRPDWERDVLAVDGTPPRLISLRLLAEGFAALEEAALHDPQGAVAGLMAEYAAAERPGVLHLRAEWPADEVDGMDRTAFAEAVQAVVCPPDAAGVEGFADGASLLVTVTVTDAEASGRNTLMLDLGRVLDLYAETREKRPDATPEEVLREVVPGLLAAGGPGLTWVRPPTEQERDTVTTACAPPSD